MEWIVLLIIVIAAAVGIYVITSKKARETAAALEAEPRPKEIETQRKPRELGEAPREKRVAASAEQATSRIGREGRAAQDREAPSPDEGTGAVATEHAPGAVDELGQPTDAAEGTNVEVATEHHEVVVEEEPPAVRGKPVAGTPAVKHVRDVAAVRKGLGKAREKDGFFGRLATLFAGRKEIDTTIADGLQEVLIGSDVGVKTTDAILDRIRDGLSKKELSDVDKVWTALRREAQRILSLEQAGLVLKTKPTVVLMVGVNGCGKTTTIGKLATRLQADGRKVVVAAGDTFRAAAVQQLEVWGKRAGCEVVKGKDGADPGAVIFEAIRQSSNVDADVVIADTAGRLHTKTPLMDELKKVHKTMGKAMAGAPHEIFLVIDATNGQNALAQSRQFAEALPLTGIILTKLDGTAKGGVILGICDELKLPVRYIGLGERPQDLRQFDAEEYVEALLGDRDAKEQVA